MKLADARGRFEWEQTSAQMALIVNLLRDPKKSKPVNKDRYISKMFLRGDSVIVVLRNPLIAGK